MNIEKLFNKEVMTLDTYIMFRLKEATAKLKPELIAKTEHLYHFLWVHRLRILQKLLWTGLKRF